MKGLFPDKTCNIFQHRFYLIGIISMLLVSCVHQQRAILPEQNNLADTFKWFHSSDPVGSSSFSFVLGGKLVYVDPVLFPELAATLPDADLILVTHTHRDHYSLETLKELTGPKTLIAGVRNIKASITGSIPMLPGETAEVAGLTVCAYPAYNDSHDRLMNFLSFTITDGKQTVFISGDTDMQNEFTAIHGIDVAVYFMDPPLTLSVKDAIKLTKAIKPSVIIPVHWSEGSEDMFIELEKKTRSISQLKIIQKTE